MYNMTIKSFFQKLGRGIKRGFDKFVSGAGNVIGKAGTFLQQKAIPAIASGANQVAGLIGKAQPLLEMAGPEASATGAEVADVASQVGAGVGKFAKFIGSDAPKGRMATAEETRQFRSQIPQGKSFFGIKPLPPPPMPTAPTPALVPAVMPAKPNPLKIAGALKPLIGSNPASYSPVRMSSGIEASSSDQPSVRVMGGGNGAPMLSM
jgi:hypothetical protein